LVKEIYELLKLNPGDKMARNLMVGTGFFASISCAMTPIAHTFPLMALGYYEAATGVAISYAAFMAYSVPICLLIAVVAYLLLIIGIDKKFDFTSIHFERTKWTWQEVVALIVFLAVVACWIVVGIWPTVFVTLNTLGTIWPALVGIGILMACGVLNVKDGFSKGVAWPAILLCGTTLALGKWITATEMGIIPLVSSLFVNIPPAWILFIIVVFAVVMTNLISNIVTTTVSYNLFVPMVIAAGTVSPVLATILIGIGASLAYAFPSSIAHIALAGSSGWATSKDMMKYGCIMIVASILIMGVFLL
jgi:sodium-dependent dicarboxylate transporter 2/3/5